MYGLSTTAAAYQSGLMERIANPLAQAFVGSNPTAAFSGIPSAVASSGPVLIQPPKSLRPPARLRWLRRMKRPEVKPPGPFSMTWNAARP